jgi:DNA invertase Pin-like site-specific DNA recombinase
VNAQVDCRTPPRRVAIYASNADVALRANQRAAMQRYADAMGWVTTVEEDTRRLLDGAADHAFDLVLCWRFDDLRRAESLLEHLSAHGVEMLAVAQSCTALME